MHPKSRNTRVRPGSWTTASAVLIALLATTLPVRAMAAYVVAVDHQAAGGQPYPRGCNSKQLTLTVGEQQPVNYTFTIDTGSGIPMVVCKTPASDINCQSSGGLPASSNYALDAAHTVSTAAACNATGIGCLLPDKQCFVSEPLTGGSSFNIYNGVFASDKFTFNNVLVGGQLSFQATFGCASTYISCNQDNTSTPCYQSSTECPTTPGAANFGQGSKVLQGSCPGSNHGVEAGWTFNDGSAGNTASQIGVPEQIFRAGLINERVIGFCFQQPQKDANCSASLAPNSAVVLGQRLPAGVKSTALLSAPLVPAIFPQPYPKHLAATPFTQTLRSNVLSASVPVWGELKPWTSPFQGVTVLWDSGACGQSMVPPNVFNAFVRYYNLSSAMAARNAGLLRRNWKIEPCPNAAVMCGSNVNAEPYACQQILMQGSTPSESDIAFAKRLLKSMYPATINMTVQGGAVAQLPTAFPMNICTGSQAAGFSGTAGVAVCSYVRAHPNNEYNFWVAGPWFTGRYVQFSVGKPAAGFPGSIGTVSWSQPLGKCTF